jgi:hypothetical protein
MSLGAIIRKSNGDKQYRTGHNGVDNVRFFSKNLMKIIRDREHARDSHEGYADVGNEIVGKPRRFLKRVAQLRAKSEYYGIYFLKHEASSGL